MSALTLLLLGASSCGAADTGTTYWEIVLLSGRPWGYTETQVELCPTSSGPDWRWTQTTYLHARRFGHDSRQTVTVRSLQGTSGCLRKCDWELSELGSRNGGSAQVSSSGLDLLLFSGEIPRAPAQRVAWQPDWGGYFAVEQSLRDRPLQPGDHRRQVLLVPMFHQIANVELRAGAHETQTLVDQSATLLRVEQTTILADGTRIESTLWCDAAGSILCQETPALDQRIVRVERAVALQTLQTDAIDLSSDVLVPVVGLESDPHFRQQMVYELHWPPTGNPAAGPTDPCPFRLPDSREQRVQVLENGRLEITVQRQERLRQYLGASDLRDPPPDAIYLGDSRWIAHRDPRIMSLAQRAVAVKDGAGDWQTACQLERFVFDWITRKEFATAFASALDVARERRGDCTEHAVLLAALCRAQAIPARVAAGLVYVGTSPDFAFHMWTEAWIDGQWVGLDATRAQEGIGPGHIKICDSALDDSTGITGLLPLLRFLKGTQLAVKPEP